MTMGSGELAHPMAEAAEALFGRYATLGQDEHEEAVSVFARYERPYYDAPRGRWLVGSYPLARSILKDDRLGNDLSLAHIRTNSEQLRTRLSPDAPSLLFIDPPAHNLIKTELARLFSREALEELGDTLRERWHDALSGLHAGSQVKLGGAAVHPICVEAVFATLGLAQPAPDELPALVDDLYQVNLLFDLNASAEQRTCSQAANQRLRDLVIGLLPGSAVAERMSVAGASTGVIVSTTVFMLRAGVVTLGSLLMSTLAERLSPHGCPAGAMNLHSLLVRHTPTGDTGRVTTQNVSLGGVDLPARSTVLALISAANAGLVMEAASLAGHLVFGAGTHRCVGERLVRMQVEAAIDATSSCTRHVTPVSTEPHRTPSFRGFREIQVEVDGGTR